MMNNFKKILIFYYIIKIKARNIKSYLKLTLVFRYYTKTLG